jgi:type II secretory pathway pseudopilin PulG
VKSVVKNNAFTIVELLVAMGLLVMLLTLSGLVFSTTVEAHRKAGASIDISRNLRAVTDQLGTDLRGLRKDAPLFIWFNAVDTNGDTVPDTHYDAIHFFADGDFQTMRQYSDGTANKTVYGNIARVYYGHANIPAAPPAANYQTSGLLSRKSHILTSDSDILNAYGEIPLISNWPTTPNVINYAVFAANFGGAAENQLEFNTITLTNWINALNYIDSSLPAFTDNADSFIDRCMDDDSRPFIDLADYQTLHLLLSQGVLRMQIQWAYEPTDLMSPVAGFNSGIRWWPDADPDGNRNFTDSDFDVMKPGIAPKQFGVHFELPGGSTVADWFPVGGCGVSPGVAFKPTFYPRALKFTFVLKDSNGLFVGGKTFTHIVYLDN